MEKYLLCRPRGGLNDLLCQVEFCWRYAERFDRTLVIDTSRSGLGGAFSRFFSPRVGHGRVEFEAPDRLLDKLNRSSCLPVSVQGRLSDYQTDQIDSENHVEKMSGERLSFDFSRDHDETVLVHEQYGGGTGSINALRRVRLSDEMIKTVRAALAEIGTGYDAVHIRDTDYKTDAEFLFKAISRRVAGKRLLVCSDNPVIVDRAKYHFRKSDVITVSKLPQTGARPLHDRETFTSDEELKQTATSSIVDLLALGNAENYYYTDVRDGFPSGFSRLAALLYKDKKVISELLGEPNPGPGPRRRRRAHHVKPWRVKLKKAVPKFLRS